MRSPPHGAELLSQVPDPLQVVNVVRVLPVQVVDAQLVAMVG
jgi:hypothetical protein